jgi:hypothetical protein
MMNLRSHILTLIIAAALVTTAGLALAEFAALTLLRSFTGSDPNAGGAYVAESTKVRRNGIEQPPLMIPK